jgi:hypothetical protein
MNVRLRASRVAAGAALSSAVLLLASVPASAATVPDWPTSRVPVCQPTTVAPAGSGLAITYDDTTVPTVSGWTYNGSRSRLVLSPGSEQVTLSLGIRQGCSGVGSVTLVARQSLEGGSPITSSFLVEPLTSDVFNGPWGFSQPREGTITGWAEIVAVITGPRYSQFILDEAFGLSSKTDGVSTTPVTGPWSTQRLYVVLASTQSTSQSRTSVAAGGSVTFRTTVRVNGGTTYVAKPGVPVKFQTKVGTGPWTTRATRTTSATGTASYTFRPSRTMLWRWVLAENISTAPYYAASRSAAKTIRVT